MTNYKQQGDVLFKSIDKLPEGLEKQGGSIVQEGESTGHAHRLSGDFQLYSQPTTKKRFLRIVKESTISHEEHMPFTLPTGDYVIDIVQESDPFSDEMHAVAD